MFNPSIYTDGEFRRNSASNTPTPDFNRRLPVVFCLDLTLSMMERKGTNGPTMLDLMNETIGRLMVDFATNHLIQNHVEVAFVGFADKVILKTEFFRISDINQSMFEGKAQTCADHPCDVEIVQKEGPDKKTYKVPKFENIHIEYRTSTKIHTGVMCAIDMLEEYKNEKAKKMVSCYIPFLVLMTDGYPSHPAEEEPAQRRLVSHCFSNDDASNLIVPLIIGIGNSEKLRDTVVKYSAGYKSGLRFIDKENAENSFREVYLVIRKSLIKSIIILNRDADFLRSLTLRNTSNGAYTKPREIYSGTITVDDILQQNECDEIED